MSSFVCKICNREFKRKDYLQKHYKRKFPCKPVNLENCKKMIPNDTKMIPNDTKMIPDDTGNTKNMLINNNQVVNSNITSYNCKYCKEIFINKRSLYRHKNELRCQQMPAKEIKKIKLYKKNKIIKQKLKEESAIITVNNTSNHTHNHINNINNGIINNVNIKINPFGEENLNSISNDDILNILNKAYASIPNVLKHIHFNIKENRNLYQPNINKPYIKYYDGKRWLSDKFESVSEKLLSNISTVLEEWFISHQSNFNGRKQKIIENMLEDYNDGKMEENFNNEFKLFLMNYNNDIKEHIVNEIKNSNLFELM